MPTFLPEDSLRTPRFVGNPNYDPGQISALLAATVTAEILALIAAHRRDQRALSR